MTRRLLVGEQRPYPIPLTATTSNSAGQESTNSAHAARQAATTTEPSRAPIGHPARSIHRPATGAARAVTAQNPETTRPRSASVMVSSAVMSTASTPRHVGSAIAVASTRKASDPAFHPRDSRAGRGAERGTEEPPGQRAREASGVMSTKRPTPSVLDAQRDLRARLDAERGLVLEVFGNVALVLDDDLALVLGDVVDLRRRHPAQAVPLAFVEVGDNSHQ